MSERISPFATRITHNMPEMLQRGSLISKRASQAWDQAKSVRRSGIIQTDSGADKPSRKKVPGLGTWLLRHVIVLKTGKQMGGYERWLAVRAWRAVLQRRSEGHAHASSGHRSANMCTYPDQRLVSGPRVPGRVLTGPLMDSVALPNQVSPALSPASRVRTRSAVRSFRRGAVE